MSSTFGFTWMFQLSILFVVFPDETRKLFIFIGLPVIVPTQCLRSECQNNLCLLEKLVCFLTSNAALVLVQNFQYIAIQLLLSFS